MIDDIRRYLSSYRLRRRLARRGVTLSGDAHLFDVEFRGDAMISPWCRLVGVPRIVIGRNFFMNSFGFLKGDITIGDDVLLGPGVVIWGRDHLFAPGRPIREQGHRSEPILIGDDVWIAAGALVLRGVTIGNGAVVGAGAVVTRDVPDGAIVVGNPARVVRFRDGRSADAHSADTRLSDAAPKIR